MKQFFAALLLITLWVGPALAQPSPIFINDGQLVTNIPPQVDASIFVNNGLFDITAINLQPYDFSDVGSYTNRGTMICYGGFIFDNSPATNGFRFPSASFLNANPGTVVVGLTNTTFIQSAGSISSYPQLNVFANVITNTGSLIGDVTSVIRVEGNTLNLARGTVHVTGIADTTANNAGIVEDNYAIGEQTNILGPFFLPDISSPTFIATDLAGNNLIAAVSLTNAIPYIYTNLVDPSNTTYQAVFVNTNLTGISTDVRFQRGGAFQTPVIRYQSIISNLNGTILATNQFFISDAYGLRQTNYLLTNGTTYTGLPILAPFNYTFSRSMPNFTNYASPNVQFFDNTVLNNSLPATNAFSYEEIALSASTYSPDPTATTSSLTNTPGRIAITATNFLDLTRAKVTGANYINLMASNHFVGAAFGEVIAPTMDINLGSTNGSLAISNLVAPYISQFSGIIDMYSARWTNVDGNGVTNKYHVLIVNSALSSLSTVTILNFAARSTNVTISDLLNITSSVNINAKNVTVATNDSTAPLPYGILNMLNPSTVWSSSFPSLQNFTNNGAVVASNTTYFLTTTNDPTYNLNYQPYLSFVNTGQIKTVGDLIYANYIANIGPGTNTNLATIASNLFTAGYIGTTYGPIIMQASNAVLSGGTLVASNGDVTINAGSLFISNNLIMLSGAATFSVTNQLVDGGATSSNIIGAGDGINLLVKPKTGDFLGTTVYVSAPPELEVDNIWAGLDLSNNVAGFANNGALGHLVVTGGDANSQFYFGGLDAVTNYALYVDLLELVGGATNRVSEANGNVNFAAFDIAPNFKIYFADALIGTNDISEKLNGANGGQFVWISAYAGIFSSTSVTYPSGITYQFNRALKNSPDISSNGQTPNANTIYPFSVNLGISHATKPTVSSLLSWYSPAGSTNTVYYQTNLTSTNWLVLTNFVQGSGAGQISIKDSAHTNSPAFYKVQISPAH